MAGDIVAHGQVRIDLDDQASRELDALEAKYKSTMASIDRMEADVTIDANISQFEAKYKQAKDAVRILEGQKATVDVEADTSELDAALAEARREVKRLDGMKATIEIDSRQAREAATNVERLTKLEIARAQAEHQREQGLRRIAAQSYARTQAQGRLEAKAWAENERRDQAAFDNSLARANRLARVQSSLEKQRTMELRQAEIAAHRLNEERDREPILTAKQAAEVAKLQRRYADLTDQLEKLDTKRAPFSQEARVKLELDKQNIVAQMAAAKAQLEFLGSHPPVGIKVDIDAGLARKTLVRSMAGLARLGDRIANIGNIRINLGPLSGTIRTIASAATVLSPILVSVAGALTSVVGLLGTGLAGAGAIAAGVTTGLIANFGGMIASIKPFAQEMKIAKQATDAYQKAVLKYGEGSKEAKNAQDQMNNVLKNVDPVAAKAAQGATRMRTEWDKLTKDNARRNFGQLLTSGFQAMDRLMPSLARNSNQTFDIISRRTDSFLKSITKPAGVTLFDSIGKSANEFLEPALLGTARLSRSFLAIGESAARIFAGPAGRGFADWAAKIEAATKPGLKLDNTIARIGDHAKSLGTLFLNVGRLMATVLNGGADEGQRLADSLNDVVVRWNAFLKTAGGQRAMADFFQRTGAGAQQLAAAIGPLVGAFVQWSAMLAPFTTGFLTAVTAITRVISKITQLLSLQGPLAVFGATIATLWSINRIGAFIGALTTALGLLRNIAATQGTLAAVGALATGGVFGKGARAARGAQVLDTAKDVGQMALFTGAVGGGEKKVGIFRRAVTALIPAIGGLGHVAGGVATAGVLALGAGAVYGTIKLAKLGDVSGDLRKRFADVEGATKSYIGATATLSNQIAQTGAAQHSYREAVGRVAQAKKALAEAEKSAGKNSAEYKAALDNLNSALQTRATAEQDVDKYMKAASQSRQARTQASNEMTDAENDLADAQKRQKEIQDQINANPQRAASFANQLKKANEDVAAALDRVNAKNRAFSAAARQARVDALNYERALRGMTVLGREAAASLERLARTRPGTAQAIATKFPDEKDAGKVARSAGAALKGGVSQPVVMRIIADAKDADAAIRRLRAARLRATFQVITRGGTEAIAMLERIAGRKLTRKEQQIAQQGGPAVLGVLARIIGRRLTPKQQRVIERGGAAALSLLQRLAGLSLPHKYQRITIETVRIESVRRGSSVPVPDAARGYGAAAGQFAGDYEGPALVGEGKGPEWHFDASTGKMTKITSPRFMKLGGGDAIIPTEPAYRERGKLIMQHLAASMGIPMFAAGKPTRLTKARKAGIRERARALPVPERVQFGAVSEKQAEKDRNNARDHYQKRDATVAKLNEQIEELKKKQKAKPTKERRREIDRKTRSRDKWSATLPTLYRRFQLAEARFLELNRVNERIARMDTQQETARQEMENASRSNNRDAWQTARSRRQSILNQLRDHYTRARKLARDPNLQAQIESELANIAGSVIEASEAIFEAPEAAKSRAQEVAEIPALSLEEFLTNIGRLGEYQQLQQRKLFAQIDTPADPADDRTAAEQLVKFYEEMFSRVRSQAVVTQRPQDIALMNEIGSELISARGDLAGLMQPTANEAAVNAQLTERLKFSEDQRKIAEAFVAVAGGPGDIGTGNFSSARMAAGAGPNIFIQTLHPADPATLSAIGSAATAGMSYQGARPAPRSWSGY